MQKVAVGNVEITPIQDAAVLMDPHQFIPQYAEQFLTEYKHLADERGLMGMSITTYLIRSEGQNLLVDTGLGKRRRPGFPVGKLDEALKAAGVGPEEIDVVLNTHLHIDHVGWNTVEEADGTTRVFFPKARFLFQQAEWDFWMQPEHMDNPQHAHLKECVEPLKGTGRIEMVKGEVAIDRNLTYISTPGHTPGHVAIGIASAGKRAVIIGDASHHPAQLDHPDWSPAFDTDPVQSARTRDALFDRVAAEGSRWLAGHWEFPGVGNIVRLDGKRVFRAL